MGINKRDFGKGTISGYGIQLNDLTCGNVISFITKHRGIVQSLYPEVELDDMLGWLYYDNKISDNDFESVLYDHGMDFFPYIIGLVLNIDHGTTGFLGFVGEESFGDCLLWMPLYPWEMTDSDKNITKEELDEIFAKLLDELGIKGTPRFLSLFYDDFPADFKLN